MAAQERKNEPMKQSGDTDLAGSAGRAPAARPGAAETAASTTAGSGPAASGPAASGMSAAENAAADAAAEEVAAIEPTPDPIAAFEAELAAARSEAAAHRDSWYRTAADLDNFRKRSARELVEGQERARGEVLLAMIQVLDDVERALAASAAPAAAGAEESGPEGAPADPIVAGLRLIRGRITDHLRRFGVSEIEAAGAEFDPHVHEAVMQAPAAGVPAGHVAHVLERGYRLNDRVLRPARVAVASGEPA